MGLCEDYLTCDIAFNAVMPLSHATTCGRYSRIEGVTALSSAVEPSIDLTLHGSRDAELPDSSPATDSEPPAPVPIKSNWAPIMEFTSADIFQHSPFGEILNSLRSLSLSGESWPNYVRQDWDADDEEIRRPPTTHLVATVG